MGSWRRQAAATVENEAPLANYTTHFKDDDSIIDYEATNCLNEIGQVYEEKWSRGCDE